MAIVRSENKGVGNVYGVDTSTVPTGPKTWGPLGPTMVANPDGSPYVGPWAERPQESAGGVTGNTIRNPDGSLKPGTSLMDPESGYGRGTSTGSTPTNGGGTSGGSIARYISEGRGIGGSRMGIKMGLGGDGSGSGGFGDADWDAMGSAQGNIMGNYGAMLRQNAAELKGYLNQFKSEFKSLLGKYGVSTQNISKANKGLSGLLSDPSQLLNDPVFKDFLDAQENAITRQMIAQGHNPAESGFGAASLAEASARTRMEQYQTILGGYLSTLQLGAPIASQAVNMLGNLSQGYADVAGLSSSGTFYEKSKKDMGLLAELMAKMQFNAGSGGDFSRIEGSWSV